MDSDTFWVVVGAARAAADATGRPIEETLHDELVRHSPEDIVLFQKHFDDAANALYRWDVWGAAYLIGGGCSDDSFIDFRAGLITYGQAWFDRVLAGPDSLAGHPAVLEQDGERLFMESVNYLAREAFEQVTGHGDNFHTEWNSRSQSLARNSCPNLGEEFDFDDDAEMRRRLPQLAARLLG
ncbi:DUF4240 domain-containing protein [Kineosporia sp. J2-2]|uniref:DUF4240 domain-containing protein n=1 Tax=Kineosporia corallincola TaxID=2835133 RepID=A0ABS5TE94_9ACTN|nr:DUF4240 domain-containing protein [Kineosporia corallincola]MBT0769415.1 DUF4240 domain-containing protein [Kineosporia corallincola]